MKTAVVICPGRGTYGAKELGYLGRHFPRPHLLSAFDTARAALDMETLRDLDGADRFSTSRHMRGDNASPLIFAAGLGDFLSLDRDRVEVVAVTGNSMGWYTALTCGGAVSAENGFTIADTMGALMQDAMIGGQLVYPVVGADWVPDTARKAELLGIVAGIAARADHVLALSINLGGMLVLAGNDAGLAAFEAAVPKLEGRFPMRLAGHAGFHTALQQPVSTKARHGMGPDLFQQPGLPLVDGRGAIWWPGAADLHGLWDYTLGHQVVEPYDFSRAVQVAAREFAPDLFILAGPGDTMGGAVAQALIGVNWRGMGSKAEFVARQEGDPLLVTMGRADQRVLVV